MPGVGPSLSLWKANFAVIVLNTALYGVFMSLFVFCIVTMYLRTTAEARSPSNRSPFTRNHPVVYFLFHPLVAGYFVMCITLTAHFSVLVTRFVNAMALMSQQLSISEFYNNLADFTNVLDYVIVAMTLVVGDVLMTYRLWLVWERNIYIIILPMTSTVGILASCAYSTYLLAQFNGELDIFSSDLSRWFCGWAFVLTTNVYCTALISWRIFRTSRTSVQIMGGGYTLSHVAVTMIESSALFTTWTLAFVIVFHAKQVSAFILLLCWPGISGISCMLIGVCSGMRHYRSTYYPNNTESTISKIQFPDIPSTDSLSFRRARHSDASSAEGGIETGSTTTCRNSRHGQAL
ncbi:hypothetical protein FA15DRAFT_672556 [Coprinopsis marcescibilis]|uniref:G-protein coupled receptors family 1 profile domain-containing protein n=1 Tax=Coprinopsis marcescibilis TaxID=230819 RepID=A0A5C3KM32_COPMA|nr:hypothetical protein FA15DRAFT_672556 [Coprinopsis marcescibilis]